MAEKKNDLETKHYVALAVILLIIVLLIVYWQKVKAWFAGNQKPPSQTAQNTPPAGLDMHKVLKKGVTGEEVKQLQQWLGVTTDGIFGPITEGALLQKKGVAEITLSAYGQLPDMYADAAPGQEEDDYPVWTNPFSWFGMAVMPNGLASATGAEPGIFQNGINTTIRWVP